MLLLSKQVQYTYIIFYENSSDLNLYTFARLSQSTSDTVIQVFSVFSLRKSVVHSRKRVLQSSYSPNLVTEAAFYRFYQIGVLKNFVKLTEEHMCLGVILLKLQSERHRYFPVSSAIFTT